MGRESSSQGRRGQWGPVELEQQGDAVRAGKPRALHPHSAPEESAGIKGLPGQGQDNIPACLGI